MTRPGAAALLVVFLASLAPARAAAQANVVREAFAQATELAHAGDLEAAIDRLRESDVPETLAFYRPHLRVRIGEYERLLGRLDASLTTLDDVLDEIGEGDGARLLRCYALAVRAQVMLDWGLVDVASNDAGRARELLDALEAGGTTPVSEHVQVDFVQASILLAREETDELEVFVDEALQRGVYEPVPDRAAMLRALLGEVYKEAARLDPAYASRARETLELALAEEALPAFERVQPELALAELALRDTRWTDAEAWLERARRHMGASEARAARWQHRMGRTLAARLAFERTDRAPEDERHEDLRADLDRTVHESIAEWRASPLRPGGYGFLQYTQRRALVSEWVRLELATGDAGAERALAALIDAGDACTLARRLEAGSADLAEAREKLLGPEGALLVYFPGPDRSHLFVADREHVTHVSLAANDVLQQARYEAARALERIQATGARGSEAGGAGDGMTRAWRAALERLADLLVPTEARAAVDGRKRLVIVGRDLLGDVPFEALPLGPGRWLGTDLAVSHLPSLGVGLELAARAASEDRRAPGAGAAMLVAAPTAAKLTLTRADAEDVLRAYPDEARMLAFGAEASPASLRGASGALVLEVLTHGRRDPLRERPMTFLLDDAHGKGSVSIGAEEVERLDAPPLVVLSVCRSGRGVRRRGDAGAGELSAAFLLAGTRARCVVASAFDLEVESTRRLSRALHAGLAAGLAPDEALRAARAELASDERFADPRYHGLVAALGAACDPVFAP